jgi:hypothetical protein
VISDWKEGAQVREEGNSDAPGSEAKATPQTRVAGLKIRGKGQRPFLMFFLLIFGGSRRLKI